MNIKIGNLLTKFDRYDFILITTNSFVKENRRLVMGAGIAKHIRDTYKDIDLDFGEQILKYDSNEYLILRSKLYPKIFAFQVKYLYNDKARLDLIRKSTNYLIRSINELSYVPKIAMNFPGIGNGHLNENKVYEVIKILPECVDVYKLG